MTAMSEGQAKYRMDLINKTVDNLMSKADPMAVLRAMLAVNLPEPTDGREASAQIDALKMDIRTYRPDHAQAILNALGNEGFGALVMRVKEIVSVDHKLDLARGSGSLAGVASLVVSELMDTLSL